jgi:hypothetical protein
MLEPALAVWPVHDHTGYHALATTYYCVRRTCYDLLQRTTYMIHTLLATVVTYVA